MPPTKCWCASLAPKWFPAWAAPPNKKRLNFDCCYGNRKTNVAKIRSERLKTQKLKGDNLQDTLRYYYCCSCHSSKRATYNTYSLQSKTEVDKTGDKASQKSNGSLNSVRRGKRATTKAATTAPQSSCRPKQQNISCKNRANKLDKQVRLKSTKPVETLIDNS